MTGFLTGKCVKPGLRHRSGNLFEMEFVLSCSLSTTTEPLSILRILLRQ